MSPWTQDEIDKLSMILLSLNDDVKALETQVIILELSAGILWGIVAALVFVILWPKIKS